MRPQEIPPPQVPHFVVPALEGLAIHFGLLAFSNLVTHEPFALISADTVGRNLRLSAWTIDGDKYFTNQFGHALQGSFHFNAARSSGLGFWWSAFNALFQSTMWELFFEAEPPSVNDGITTP